MFQEKILSSDIKDDLICFMIHTEHFPPFPGTESEVLAVIIKVRCREPLPDHGLDIIVADIQEEVSNVSRKS